jgi:hypothetical protein
MRRNCGWLPFIQAWKEEDDASREVQRYSRVYLDRDGWNAIEADELPIPDMSVGSVVPRDGTIYAVVAIDHRRRVVVYKEVLA